MSEKEKTNKKLGKIIQDLAVQSKVILYVAGAAIPLYIAYKLYKAFLVSGRVPKEYENSLAQVKLAMDKEFDSELEEHKQLLNEFESHCRDVLSLKDNEEIDYHKVGFQRGNKNEIHSDFRACGSFTLYYLNNTTLFDNPEFKIEGQYPFAITAINIMNTLYITLKTKPTLAKRFDIYTARLGRESLQKDSALKAFVEVTDHMMMKFAGYWVNKEYSSEEAYMVFPEKFNSYKSLKWQDDLASFLAKPRTVKM